MKKWVVAALVAVLLVPVAGFAQNPPKDKEKEKDTKIQAIDVTGVWDTIVESPQGAINVTTTFKQEGEKLTGTQASPMGETALEGTVSGTDVKFGMTIDMGGQSMSIAFAGKVEGDTITGVFDFGGMGSGSWSAKKQKK
ncbi:MAG: hypothetical protein WCP29_11880 [Acidobacteriota bacterium]